jgi:hypothetical protein
MASVKTRLIPGKKRAPQLLADSTLMRCALDRLAQSMLSPVTAPRLDFRQTLRAELVAQAALRAAAVRTPGRAHKIKKPKGGFRLAALGIGISAAGGGFALAANRVATPELPQAPATQTAAPSVHRAAASPSIPGISGAPGAVPLHATTAAGAGRVVSAAPQAPNRSTLTGLSIPAPPPDKAVLPSVATGAIDAAVGSPATDPATTLPAPRTAPDISPLFSRTGEHWVWPTLPATHRP